MTHGEMLVAKGWRRVPRGSDPDADEYDRTVDGSYYLWLKRGWKGYDWRIQQTKGASPKLAPVREGRCRTLLGAAREAILVATGLIAVSP